MRFGHVINTDGVLGTHNLGHLIFLLGLALTFWSWFALIIVGSRAFWFHRRVLQDEERLETIFGAAYVAYCAQVKRWIPGVL
jgi:protein-S-isoprenylcysteine O-methyltransferase Ste14